MLEAETLCRDVAMPAFSATHAKRLTAASALRKKS